MNKDLKKAFSIIASKRLKETEKVDRITAILEENPDIVHAKASNDTFESMELCGIVGPYRDKITLLHFVAILNYAEVAKLLIEKGADVNAISGNVFKYTPLHEAIFRGSKGVVKLLLGCNANIESKDRSDSTPLHHASDNGNEEVVKLLLEKGANVNAVSSDYSGYRETPLHKAITKSHVDEYLRIVKMLLDYGANTEIEDLNYGTPLHKAIEFGQIEAIRLLLEAKANVNARNKRGETPLHVVIHVGLERFPKEEFKVAELLLEHGADVHAKDENGNTPLHIAAVQRSKEIVKLFLEHGANINETNNYGITVLKMATYRRLFGSINDKIDPEPTVKFLIRQTLKNNPSIEKPEFLNKMENSSYYKEAEYSEYWDKCRLSAQPC